MTAGNTKQFFVSIWSVADWLCGAYRPSQHERVILPLTILRLLSEPDIKFLREVTE